MPTQKSLIEKIILPEILDDCYLYFAQTRNQIPFPIKRIYFILKSNPNLSRGFHAHHKTKQVIFCIQGSIKLKLDDGKSKDEIILNHPGEGIILDKMIWHEMHEFKKNTILLVITSHKFNAKDYIRDYKEFKTLTKP